MLKALGPTFSCRTLSKNTAFFSFIRAVGYICKARDIDSIFARLHEVFSRDWMKNRRTAKAQTTKELQYSTGFWFSREKYIFSCFHLCLCGNF
jgi:hypothetical protein